MPSLKAALSEWSEMWKAARRHGLCPLGAFMTQAYCCTTICSWVLCTLSTVASGPVVWTGVQQYISLCFVLELYLRLSPSLHYGFRQSGAVYFHLYLPHESRCLENSWCLTNSCWVGQAWWFLRRYASYSSCLKCFDFLNVQSSVLGTRTTYLYLSN